MRVEQEQIEVSSYLPRPDPAWSFTDSHGHEHRWVADDRGQYKRGQWHWELDPGEPEFYFDSDGEEYNGDGRHRCDLCGDEVKPGMRGSSMFAEYIPGMISYYLDDQPITKAEADAFIERERAAADLRRCAAVTPDSGARCDLPRGHKGSHHVTEQRAWTA